MSRLNDIFTNLGATLFCMGQDWTKGDGSAMKVDGICNTAELQAKAIIIELAETHSEDGEHINLASFVADVRAL